MEECTIEGFEWQLGEFRAFQNRLGEDQKSAETVIITQVRNAESLKH